MGHLVINSIEVFLSIVLLNKIYLLDDITGKVLVTDFIADTLGIIENTIL